MNQSSIQSNLPIYGTPDSVLLHNAGDAFYITKHDSVPLKLIPPYGHVDTSDHHGIHVDVCHVNQGENAYLGLKGGGAGAD